MKRVGIARNVGQALDARAGREAPGSCDVVVLCASDGNYVTAPRAVLHGISVERHDEILNAFIAVLTSIRHDLYPVPNMATFSATQEFRRSDEPKTPGAPTGVARWYPEQARRKIDKTTICRAVGLWTWFWNNATMETTYETLQIRWPLPAVTSFRVHDFIDVPPEGEEEEEDHHHHHHHHHRPTPTTMDGLRADALRCVDVVLEILWHDEMVFASHGHTFLRSKPENHNVRLETKKWWVVAGPDTGTYLNFSLGELHQAIELVEYYRVVCGVFLGWDDAHRDCLVEAFHAMERDGAGKRS